MSHYRPIWLLILAAAPFAGCNAVSRVEWLPDSSGFIVHDLTTNRIHRYEIDSGDVTSFSGGGYCNAALSPDGRLLAFVEPIEQSPTGVWRRSGIAADWESRIVDRQVRVAELRQLLARMIEIEPPADAQHFQAHMPIDELAEKIVAQEFSPVEPVTEPREMQFWFRLRICDLDGNPRFLSEPFEYGIASIPGVSQMVPGGGPLFWSAAWHPNGKSVTIFSAVFGEGGIPLHTETHLFELERSRLKTMTGVVPFVFADPLMRTFSPFAPDGSGFLALRTPQQADKSDARPDDEKPTLRALGHLEPVWVNSDGNISTVETSQKLKALLKRALDRSQSGEHQGVRLDNSSELPVWRDGLIHFRAVRDSWAFDPNTRRLHRQPLLDNVADGVYRLRLPFGPNGQTVRVTWDGSCSLFDGDGKQRKHLISGIDPLLGQATVSPDGRYLLVSPNSKQNLQVALFDQAGTRMKLSPTLNEAIRGDNLADARDSRLKSILSTRTQRRKQATQAALRQAASSCCPADAAAGGRQRRSAQ